MKTIGVYVVYISLLLRIVEAAPLTLDYWAEGKLLPKFWEGVVILYAVASEWKADAQDVDLPILFKFKPLATIAGQLDPLCKPAIQARGAFRGFTPGISKPPEPNSRVIVVLRERKDGRGYDLPPFPMEFMPNREAVFPVTGDPSPKIEGILKAVRELKGKKP